MQNDNTQEPYYSQAQQDSYALTAQQERPTNQGGSASNSIHWTASEFVQHDKQSGWYMGLAAATVLVATAAYFLLNGDLFAPIIVLILGITFGVAGARKPRVLEYSLDEYGLVAGSRHYTHEDFKSFAVLSEGPVSSLILMPSKRLSPSLTLYAPQDQIDNVVNTLGMFLPLEQHEVGFIDNFLSKIRF